MTECGKVPDAQKEPVQNRTSARQKRARTKSANLALPETFPMQLKSPARNFLGYGRGLSPQGPRIDSAHLHFTDIEMVFGNSGCRSSAVVTSRGAVDSG
ncbi:hypothetical protein N656DRAFT_374363 [Canariomyces notabilis]|uniref:Uncharacterized protein n=1 Tax=Canariomyces notabilis TaxID=2074819 RepID=A0AAN6QEK0_9PEZI|nr:hypothetical protein N656DRAFT_374363 [Canariomyces arenarius]